jgi:hypothetical protein
MQMYTDQELMDLWAQNEQPLPFARSVLAGEKVVDEVSYRSNQLPARGATYKYFWPGAVAWKKPYGPAVTTASLPNKPRYYKFSIDLTTLVRKWIDQPSTNFGIALSSTGDCTFFSTEETDASGDYRPCLMLDDQRIECVADVSFNSSGLATQASNPTIKVANYSWTGLRFADIPKDAQFSTARMVLTVSTNWVSTTSTVRVHELLPQMQPPTRCTDLFSEECYYKTQIPGVGSDARDIDIRKQLVTPSVWKKTEWLEDCVRGWFTPGYRSVACRIPLFNATGAEAREASFQYDVRLGENFLAAIVETGKFPGFASSGVITEMQPLWPGEPNGRHGELYAGNSQTVHGNDGWTLRGGYAWPLSLPDHYANGQVPLHTYSYHLWREIGGKKYLHQEIIRRYEEATGSRIPPSWQQAAAYVQPGEVLEAVSPYGIPLLWDAYAPSGLVKPGEWTTIRQDMRVNDPGVANGWLRSYVNGKQVGQIDNLCLRLTKAPVIPNSTLAIGQIYFSFYHGGIQWPRASTTIDVKRLAVKVIEWDN